MQVKTDNTLKKMSAPDNEVASLATLVIIGSDIINHIIKIIKYVFEIMSYCF